MALLMFGALVFFFPVAAYFLYLAMLNSREHPTVISGPWDFAGVLFAVSGFLFAGGPSILAAFYARFRVPMAQGQIPRLSGIFGDGWGFWILLWAVYFTIVIGGGLWLLLQRRSATVIYNVEPAALDEVLAQTLDELRLSAKRIANRVVFLPSVAREEGDASLLEAVQSPGERPRLAGAARGGSRFPGENGTPHAAAPRGELRLDPFPSMKHVTLHWYDIDRRTRGDVEAELSRRLGDLTTPENAAAGWFLTIASCLFGALLLALVGFILFSLRR